MEYKYKQFQILLCWQSCVLRLFTMYSVHKIVCFNCTSRCRAEQRGEVSPLTTHSHPIFPHGLDRAIQLRLCLPCKVSMRFWPNQKTSVSRASKHFHRISIPCTGRSQKFSWVGHQKTFNSRFSRMARDTWPSFLNNSFALVFDLSNTNCKSLHIYSGLYLELPRIHLQDILGPIFIFMVQYTKISNIYTHPYPFAYTHTVYILAISNNTRSHVIPFKQSQLVLCKLIEWSQTSFTSFMWRFPYTFLGNLLDRTH